MIFSFSNWSRWRVIVCAMLAASFVPWANGQSLLSAPDQQGASGAPSLSPQNPALNIPDSSQPSFNFNSAPDVAAFPQNAPTPAQIKQWQTALDKQKNWALMTPEEILGVTTPEKILGNDSSDEDKTKSVFERFLDRQQRERQEGAIGNANTNGGAIFDTSPKWNFPSRENVATKNSGFFSGANNGGDSLNFPFNGTPDASRAPNAPMATTSWLNTFGSPAMTPEQTPEQLEAEQEFQKLLQPHSAPSEKSAPRNSSFSSFQTTPDPLFAQPANSAGISYAPLTNGIVTPNSVKPLPGLFDQNSVTPVAPSWKPQPPPWESSKPHPGKAPQRPF